MLPSPESLCSVRVLQLLPILSSRTLSDSVSNQYSHLLALQLPKSQTNCKMIHKQRSPLTQVNSNSILLAPNCYFCLNLLGSPFLGYMKKLFCFQLSDHPKKIRCLVRLRLDHTIMLKVILRPSIYQKSRCLPYSEYFSLFINIIL